VPVGAGTDATRVASFNPWVSLYWLVAGRTLGGLPLYPQQRRLDREQALALWTTGSAWFSGEQDVKGRIAVGQYADLAVLSADYFSIPEDEIKWLSSVLTMVGGDVVHGSGDFAPLAPPLPPASPDWSPVRVFGGHQHARNAARAAALTAHRCLDHNHHPDPRVQAASIAPPKNPFWGALGCACFAF